MATWPEVLEPGAQVRVIAPSMSMGIIGDEVRTLAVERLRSIGLEVTFGAHVDEVDQFLSSSIASRTEDLHTAFADPAVDGILTVIGGFNANQLLPFIDWDLIRDNPKVFCGFSDITALSLAMYARCGLVTLSGPHFSSFGMRHHAEQTIDWFRAIVLDGARIEPTPSPEWTDDPWFLDQEARVLRPNDGWWVIRPGRTEGVLLGGNLCTMNLLQGTSYMPSLAGSVLFVEDDEDSNALTFDRDLVSLTQQPEFEQVRGLVIGRFQAKSGIDRDALTAMLTCNPALAEIPVVANVDFGHTSPMLTLPVGGSVSLDAADERVRLVIGGR